MTRPTSAHLREGGPAIRRLAALAKLEAEAVALLERAAEKPLTFPARRELVTEGRLIPSPLLLLDGWAARVRIVPEGRRQLIGFVLPGEIVGNCGFDAPIAASTIITLTAITACQLPQHKTPGLDRAYALSRALDEAYLMAQIVRLGRFDAADRLIDLLLELDERLGLAGLSDRGAFDFPITQEMLADVLGLTSVHVNRIVQHARKREDLVWTGHSLRLRDVETLRTALGRENTRVS